VQVVDATANDAIAAADVVAFGATAAVISHSTFSSKLNNTVASRLNILPHLDPFFQSTTCIYL
jgi:hypothetical protein